MQQNTLLSHNIGPSVKISLSLGSPWVSLGGHSNKKTTYFKVSPTGIGILLHRTAGPNDAIKLAISAPPRMRFRVTDLPQQIKCYILGNAFYLMKEPLFQSAVPLRQGVSEWLKNWIQPLRLKVSEILLKNKRKHHTSFLVRSVHWEMLHFKGAE
jgi:hypothetical protein